VRRALAVPQEVQRGDNGGGGGRGPMDISLPQVGRLARSSRTRPPELVPAVGHGSSVWLAPSQPGAQGAPARSYSPSTRQTIPKPLSSELVLLATVRALLQHTGSGGCSWQAVVSSQWDFAGFLAHRCQRRLRFYFKKRFLRFFFSFFVDDSAAFNFC
jgi:hypothetical protein